MARAAVALGQAAPPLRMQLPVVVLLLLLMLLLMLLVLLVM